MSTMGTRAKSSACSVSTRPTRSQVAAVADDDEVGVEVRLRRGAEALDLGHEVVHRGHRIGAHGVDPSATGLQGEGDGQRGAEGIRLGVAVADGHDAPRRQQPGGTASAGTAARSAWRQRARSPQRPRRSPGPAERVAVHAPTVAGRERLVGILGSAAPGSLSVCGVGSAGSSALGSASAAAFLRAAPRPARAAA